MPFTFAVKWVRPILKRDEQIAKMKAMHEGVGNSGSCKTTGGHVGDRTLVYMMTARFYWPRMVKQIKAYVAACHDCQMKKVRKLEKSKETLHPIPIPMGKHWYQLGMDLMFLKPVKGYIGVLTVVDYFTKWVEVVPIRSKSAIEIGFHLWQMFLRHGTPKIVISDQGREFVNGVIDELFALTKAKHRITAAYHPQTNGQTER